jgi:hypothetical protein
MDGERWLRPSAWRYALLATAVALAVAAGAATSVLFAWLGLLEDKVLRKPAGDWVRDLLGVWAVFLALGCLAYLLDRREAWRVDASGIALHRGGQPKQFLRWSEVAGVWVLPLGFVLAWPRDQSARVVGLAGVPPVSARWLQQFARQQLVRVRHEAAAGPDASQ